MSKLASVIRGMTRSTLALYAGLAVLCGLEYVHENHQGHHRFSSKHAKGAAQHALRTSPPTITSPPFRSPRLLGSCPY